MRSLSSVRAYRFVKRNITSYAEMWRVNRSFRHLRGPRVQTLGDDDVAVVLLGRNVSHALGHFVEHHCKLGARHVLYVDNGSTDDSIEKALSLDDVVVASCSANFRKHQSRIRYLCATKYFRGGWRLMLDADELFDFPGSDRHLLGDLTRELRKRNQTGVVAQMLDLAPLGRISESRAETLEEAVRTHVGYHLGSITSVEYHSPMAHLRWFLAQNSIASPNIHLLFGGLRARLFGEDCMLTKHPLIRMAPGVVPMVHPHISTGLRCAGFTGLIRHFKFSGDYPAREREELDKNLRANVDELRRRVSAFDETPDFNFSFPEMRVNPTMEILLDEGFIVADDESRRFLRL